LHIIFFHDATYVEQTGKQLMTHISEHKNHIRRKTTFSVVTDHKLRYGHEFKLDEVEVLDIEQSYKKQLISEMIKQYKMTKERNSFKYKHRFGRFHYIPKLQLF